MTITAQIAGDGDSPEFDRVLATFDEDALMIIDTTDPLPTHEWSAQIRTSEGEMLSQLYQTCAERGVVLDVLRIHHDQAGTGELGNEAVSIGIE